MNDDITTQSNPDHFHSWTCHACGSDADTVRDLAVQYGIDRSAAICCEVAL